MTIDDMFGQSVLLTIFGMSAVFSFLIILVVFITITGKVIHALGLDKEKNAQPALGASNAMNGNVVAAITAAVKEYRKE